MGKQFSLPRSNFEANKIKLILIHTTINFENNDNKVIVLYLQILANSLMSVYKLS